MIVVIEKFKEVCEKFGGQYYTERRLTKEAKVCEFDDFDGYETFSIWLQKQKIKDDKFYISRWKFSEDLNRYVSEFEKHRDREKLSYETEKYITSQESLQNEFGKIFLNADMSSVMSATRQKVDKHIENLKPLYLRDKTSIDVGFNPNYNYYFAKASSTISADFHLAIKPTLKDISKVTENIVQSTSDIFFEELAKEMFRGKYKREKEKW